MRNIIRYVPAAALFVALSAPVPALAGDGVRVANEGAIRDQWMLADRVTPVAPGYPAAHSGRGDNVCVAVGYRINPDGTTGEFTLLRGWTSSTGEQEPEPGFFGAFSQASAAALSQWRFKPRPEVSVPRPVDTVATMTFMGRQAEDAAGLRARCQVKDLAAFLEQTKVERARRGDIQRHELDKQYKTTVQNEMRANQAARGSRGP